MRPHFNCGRYFYMQTHKVVKKLNLRGRTKIYTDERKITRENIVQVLAKAYAIHRQNAYEIQFLKEYERGNQPLLRDKKIRSDIDIRVSSCIPNVIKEFKVGYSWASPIMLVQRGDTEMHDTKKEDDDNGISALNEVIYNAENVATKDTQLGDSVELYGVGYKMVDIRTQFEGTESLFHDYCLDPQHAFCIYYNGAGEEKVLGVTFSKLKNANRFTCITNDRCYEIVAGSIVNEWVNPFGMINIVEFERSFDRSGCFERAIPQIDSLNIQMSDYANDTAQRTQEIWWGNDIDFRKNEETGEIEKPESGDWVLTYSGEGTNPKIQPMSNTFNGNSVLNSISSVRKTIFQDCKVPIQYENSGGGSTGTATDMSAGWSAAELDAARQQKLTEKGKREELALILIAIKNVPSSVLPMDSPIRKVHLSDVNFHFGRKKNYDMSIKANSFATLVSHGIHGRHALKYIDAFEDTEQVWIDSKEMIEKYQKSLFEKQQSSSDSSEKSGLIMSDNSDQEGNSPILDGMNTRNQNQGGVVRE